MPQQLDFLHPTVARIFKQWHIISFFGVVAALVTLLFFTIGYLGLATSVPPPTPQPQPLLAPLSTVAIEATVVSVEFDSDEAGCAGRCPGSQYPHDRATLRLEAIDRSNDPQGVIQLVSGSTVTVELTYSGRPAKLLRDSATDARAGAPPDGTVSYTTYLARPIPLEGGYLIYRLPIDSSFETTLPGLSSGDRIRVAAFNPEVGLGRYEVTR